MIPMKTKRSLTALSLIALTTFVVAAPGIAAPVQGGGDPGGGDRVSKFFERVKLDAWKIVAYSVNFQSFDNDSQLKQIGLPAFRSWYLQNAWMLATDLYNLKLVWVKENKSGGCGETQIVDGIDHANPPRVYMSFNRCDGYSYDEAVEHLIGESLHHFGFDNQKAAAAAGLIRAAWKRNPGVDAGIIGTYTTGLGTVFAIDPQYNLYVQGRMGFKSYSEWTTMFKLKAIAEDEALASVDFKCPLQEDKWYPVKYRITVLARDQSDHSMNWSRIKVKVIYPAHINMYCAGKWLDLNESEFEAVRNTFYQ